MRYSVRPVQPITHHPAIVSGEDEYGNPKLSFAEDVERLVYGWVLSSSSEENAEGGRTVSVIQVYSPSFAVTPDDEVSIEGVGRMPLQGRPTDYGHGPFGFEPGMVFNLLLAEESRWRP